MSKAKRELNLIRTEIKLNRRAVIARIHIQKAQNEKELEMLDIFEKWTSNLEGLLDEEEEE